MRYFFQFFGFFLFGGGVVWGINPASFSGHDFRWLLIIGIGSALVTTYSILDDMNWSNTYG